MCKCAFKVGCVSALADWQTVSIEPHKSWMDGCGFILTRVWLHVVHYECADGVTITAKRKGTLCTPHQSSPREHCSNQFSGSGYA